MNEALMNFRKKRSAKCVALDDVEGQKVAAEAPERSDDPEARFAWIEMQESVSKALGSFTPRLCITFVLREVEDLSVKETAETLGSSASAVKSRLKRARFRLRDRLRRLEREDSSPRIT
jgi:RNA polymerase sigma-70 factor (ECF subfamily)